LPLIRSIRQKLKKPLTSLWVCVFIDIFGYSMLTPFLPQIMLEMDVPVGLIGVLLSIPPLLGFLTNILWGSLSDRFGRKPIILILRIGTLLNYLILAVASNLYLIVLSRVVAGIFNAIVPISMTMVSDTISPEQRSMELSKVGAAWLVGNILGPFIGALVVGTGAFGIGMVNYLLIGITIFITIFFIDESHARSTKVIPGEEISERKSIVSLGLLKKPLPRLLLLQSLFNRIPYFMFVMTTSLYVTIRFGFTTAQIGSFFTILSVISLLIRLFLFPPTLRKLGDHQTVRLGFFLYLLAFGWLIFADSVMEFAIITIIMSFATTTAIDVMSGVMSNAVTRDKMGEMMGLNSAVESAAMVFGPIIGSSLLTSPNTAVYGLFAAGMAVVPLLLDWLPIRKLRAQRSTDQ